jgi:hypothetical protein
MQRSNSTARNSRWGDAPVVDNTGRPKIAVVSERDIERIFMPLARYRYLPADYLHALTGGSLDYLINRLALLARKPNCYVSRPQQQRANASANLPAANLRTRRQGHPSNAGARAHVFSPTDPGEFRA